MFTVHDTELGIDIALIRTPAEFARFKSDYGPGADTLKIIPSA